MTDVMPLAFLDTETTSLNPETGRIWEFAGIRRDFNDDDSGEFTERVIWFQIEQSLEHADPFSLKVGSYYQRFGLAGDWEPISMFGDDVPITDPYKDAWPVKGQVVSTYDAARLIEEFTADTTIIGNVISFDAERLDRLMKAEGRLPRWHYHIIDMEPMIIGYALAKGARFPLPYASADVGAFMGVPEPDETLRHTALGDADWVKRQWDALHEADVQRYVDIAGPSTGDFELLKAYPFGKPEE